jgi:O-antigen ligase
MQPVVRRSMEVIFLLAVVAVLFAIPFSDFVARRLLFPLCFCALLLCNTRSGAKRRLCLVAAAALTAVAVFGSVSCSLGGLDLSRWEFLRNYIYPIVVFSVLSNVRLSFLSERTVVTWMACAVVAGAAAAAPQAVAASVPGSLFFPGIVAPNISGAYACIVIAAAVNVASIARPQMLALLSYLVAISFALVGFLTRSRAFVVEVIVLCAAHLALVRRDRSLIRAGLLAAAGLIVALSVASLLFASATSWMLRDLAADFFHGRMQVWQDSLWLFKQHPTCGIGLGRFRDETFNPVYLERTGGEVYHHAHNIFLNALAEGGVLLFAAVLAAVLAGVLLCARLLKAHPQSRLVWLSSVSFGLFLMTGLIDNAIVLSLTLVPVISFAILLALRFSGQTDFGQTGTLTG